LPVAAFSLLVEMPGAVSILRWQFICESIEALEHGQSWPVVWHGRERGGENLACLLPTAIAIGSKARGDPTPLAMRYRDMPSVRVPAVPATNVTRTGRGQPEGAQLSSCF
jgi:hypothetical protein